MHDTQKQSIDLGLRDNDVVCFSHLRWDFVFQRPQHLMTRFANSGRVFFVEEPMIHSDAPYLETSEPHRNVIRCVPKLPETDDATRSDLVQNLVGNLARDFSIIRPIIWFYTPMMFEWATPLRPESALVYDCMDELSKFRFAPATLLEREAQLLAAADAVFTGGQSLYEAKKERHHNVHAFPSSIDVPHFKKGRSEQPDPEDQGSIGRPRIGYAGVIDERIDLDLLAKIADERPDWNLVMIGPVVKIDSESLPRRSNIIYLGMKKYDELPAYFAHWDVGMMPFALNESTEFISPTKTPEYLAAGLPVVSTPIKDVVRPYGKQGLVHIAANADEFVDSIDEALRADDNKWLENVDEFLSHTSWDQTFSEMMRILGRVDTLVKGAPAN